MGVRLVQHYAEVEQQLRVKCAAGLNAAAQYFVDEARENANVRTGFMMTHIGQTVPATPATLFAEVRSLAPYSRAQNDGRHGNLFWTRAWMSTRIRFKDFFIAEAGSAGRGVVGAAMQEFDHNVTGQGLRVTKARAYGGGYAMRNHSTGRFAGSYGGKH